MTEEFPDDGEPPASPVQFTPHDPPALDDEAPQPTAADYQQSSHNKENESNKENRPAPGPVIAGPSKGARFLDRQPDATRTQFTSEPEDSQTPPPPPQQQRRKRRAQEEEEEEDDDDFGPDDREENEDRRKRVRREPVSRSARPSGASTRTSGTQSARMSGARASAPPSGRASVAPRTSNASTRTNGTGMSDASSNGRVSGASAPRRSEIPRNELVPQHIELPGERGSAEPEGSDEEEPRRLIATEIRIRDQENRRTRGRNVQQGRQPWTDEQTQTLINCVGKYGPDWSRIQAVSNTTLPVQN
jgi:hypothetical protein